MGTTTAGMGTRDDGLVAMDDAEFSPLERGIITRARRAGFAVDLLRGLGSTGEIVRIAGVREDTALGLVRFSSTRINGKAEWWVQFRYWHPRKATISEIRSELDYLIDTESRHLDGDLPLR